MSFTGRAFTLLLLVVLPTCVAAQDRVSSLPGPANVNDVPVSADETFELNITERRITESDFKAASAVAVGRPDTAGLRVEVGVALKAQQLNVTLRNVRGRVRFRGSLQVLKDLITQRPAVPRNPF